MSDIGKNALKTKIDNKVYENSSQAITGTIMNEVLQDMVDTLADGGNLDAGSVDTANIKNEAVTEGKLESGVLNKIDWATASQSYYRNSQAGNVAAKTLTTYTDGYVMRGGGSLKVTFENANTADNATLNIDGKGAKPLYYNGVRVSSTNSWAAGETVEIYYNNYNSGIFYAKKWQTDVVSVSQNTPTGTNHTRISVGGSDYDVASVKDVSQLQQEKSDRPLYIVDGDIGTPINEIFQELYIVGFDNNKNYIIRNLVISNGEATISFAEVGGSTVLFEFTVPVDGKIHQHTGGVYTAYMILNPNYQYTGTIISGNTDETKGVVDKTLCFDVSYSPTIAIYAKDYIPRNDIADNLTTNDATKALSAKQGKALNDGKVNKTDIVDNLAVGGSDKVLSAAQGKNILSSLTNINSVVRLAVGGVNNSGGDETTTKRARTVHYISAPFSISVASGYGIKYIARYTLDANGNATFVSRENKNPAVSSIDVLDTSYVYRIAFNKGSGGLDDISEEELTSIVSSFVGKIDKIKALHEQEDLSLHAKIEDAKHVLDSELINSVRIESNGIASATGEPIVATSRARTKDFLVAPFTIECNSGFKVYKLFIYSVSVNGQITYNNAETINSEYYTIGESSGKVYKLELAKYDGDTRDDTYNFDTSGVANVIKSFFGEVYNLTHFAIDGMDIATIDDNQYPLKYADSTENTSVSKNITRYSIINKKYSKIKAYVGANTEASAFAIGFYSGENISQETYLSSFAINQTGDAEYFEINIPESAKLIVVQNKPGTCANPSIEIETPVTSAIKEAENQIKEIQKTAVFSFDSYDFIKHTEEASVNKRFIPFAIGTENNSPTHSGNSKYNRLNLVFMTDSHVDLETPESSLQNFKDCIDFANKNKVNISAILEGGDIVTNTYADLQEHLDNLAIPLDYAKLSDVPFIFAKGNHDMNDVNNPPSVIMTDDEWSDAWFDYAETKYGIVRQTKSNGKKSTWHYLDLPDYKVRIIAIDICDCDKSITKQNGNVLYNSGQGFYVQDEQMNWLASTALNFDDKNEKDWGVIVVTHFWLPSETTGTTASPAYDSIFPALLSLFKAFNTHSTATIAVNNDFEYDSFAVNCDADFTRYANLDAAPYFISLMYGHYHSDGNGDNQGIISIRTGSGHCGFEASDWRINRVVGTSSQNLFDVVNIDLEKRKIRLFRYGAGVRCFDGQGGDRFLPDGLSY